MKLVIISHTEHYKTDDGTIVGWGPTINEINHLLDIFDEITHIAMLQNAPAPDSALPYASSRIRFVSIPALGGTRLTDKVKILLQAPKVIKTVSKYLKTSDYFQLRTPTGIGVYLIPYLTFFTSKKGWFKYAGNWNQKNPPLGYLLQRTMLKHQSKKVTINGNWKNQPEQCLTFENPCLTEEDIKIGEQVIKNKVLSRPLTFCFVGRLELEKGVETIIKAFSQLPNHLKEEVKAIHMIGDGKDFSVFKNLSNETALKFVYHGFLSRTKVFEIYKLSDVFLLPTTASEGFPKVIAEALNFGCLPIVSNISSIGQYVENKKNGLLLEDVTVNNLMETLSLVLSGKVQYSIADNTALVNRFSYNYYNSRIVNELLN